MTDQQKTFERGVYHPQDLRRLVESIRNDERIRNFSGSCRPDQGTIANLVQGLRTLLFPGFIGPREIDDATLAEHCERTLDDLSVRLSEQVAGALRYHERADFSGPSAASGIDACESRAREIVIAFIKSIPHIRRLLSLDVQAAFDDDPAARHTDEIILCYPGIYAVSVHRMAHELHRLNVPLLPRIMSEHAHSVTAIDIHPGASIGQSFFIDHGTGVVIGETARIGDHCTLYQGVTLGAKSFLKDEQTGRLVRGGKRHPTLEDHVTIYAGATVLGGDTVIGANCVINGGVLVTQSVPPGHIVRGPKIEIKLRSNPETPPGNWSI